MYSERPLNPVVVYTTDRSKAVVTMLFLFCWFCHAAAQFSYLNHFRKHCEIDLSYGIVTNFAYEPRHDKTNKISVRPAKDEPGHPPSLIRVFAAGS